MDALVFGKPPGTESIIFQLGKGLLTSERYKLPLQELLFPSKTLTNLPIPSLQKLWFPFGIVGVLVGLGSLLFFLYHKSTSAKNTLALRHIELETNNYKLKAENSELRDRMKKLEDDVAVLKSHVALIISNKN
eukprot:TRINITY_DN1067_c0_g1_i1.p1 TRINITY_DN1067_c0_g1~~TRINITY_DN1067_c0_g1_i1.p1  ORF type:complete len:133 (-),score=7.14 TRINITY_DN1067_c0_g1_i1:98-496(-)